MTRFITNHHAMKQLHPIGPNRAMLDAEKELRREQQRRSAYEFLVTGDPEGTGVEPPYGKEWDREYNPMPYPEAEPFREDYEGSGIAALYGFFYSYEVEDTGDDSIRWAFLEMAGWPIVRTGSEVRGKKASKFADR